MTGDLPPYYDDLKLTLAECWMLLVRGARDRRAPFHTPTLATVGIDGTPQARTVVLRATDQEARTLRFHTDRRSGKVSELSCQPAVVLHFYDPAAKVQLRVGGRASLFDTGTAVGAAAWDSSQSMSRKCYGQHARPGMPVDEPAAALAGTDDSDGGRSNFVAVVVAVRSIEWLYLAHAGHRRALFVFDDPIARGRWLAP